MRHNGLLDMEKTGQSRSCLMEVSKLKISGKGETGDDPGSCHQSFEEFRVTGVGLFLTIPWCIPEACFVRKDGNGLAFK